MSTVENKENKAFSKVTNDNYNSNYTKDILMALGISNRFDNIEDRIKQVDFMIENNIDFISECNLSSVENSVAEKVLLNKLIEKMGTYIINSKDIESCRLIEGSFYESEKRYGQYAIAKATFPIDFSDSKGTLADSHIEDEYFLDELDYSKFIDIKNMKKKELNRLVRLAMRDKDEKKTRLSSFMRDIYNFTIKSLDETDVHIFDLMIRGLNDREISEQMNIPRRTINYRVNNIIENVGGFSDSED